MPSARQVFLPGGGWLRVHEQAGSGPTLVLLHGFTDHAQSYRLLLPYLAGRHIVIPDLRGHGLSSRAPITSLDDFCRDIEAMAAEMRLGVISLVGHSMGAMIAVQLGGRAKIKIGALLTLSGSLAPASAALSLVAAQFAALPYPVTVDHPFFDEWYACRRPVPEAFLLPLRQSCADMRPEDWAACLALLHRADLRDAARRVGAACLVIGGEDDPLFPESHQVALAGCLPTAERVNLPGVGHNPHWEMPKLVAEHLQQFERAAILA